MKKISSGDVSKSRKNVLGESDELSGISIKGYNFNKGIDYEKLIDSFSTTGMQADNFYKSIEIINNMIKNKAFIYFGYTSNMVTSGLRDIFRYLAEHKMVNVIVTTVGGVEEDIIKCFGDFILGDFKASGKALRKKKINRAGNIF
ncbi:deoxyhypusine synthase family protein, partial [Patescibacteria group bacterium]|nr:deoxyhypusine synthase family protein [Patescibacteria group bacterium]